MKNFLAILLASILGFGVATGIGFGIKYRHDIKDTVISWFDKDTKEETNEDVDLPEQEVINYEELYNLEKINNINLQNELNKYKGLKIDIKEELSSFIYSCDEVQVNVLDNSPVALGGLTLKKLLTLTECTIDEFKTSCTYSVETLDAVENNSAVITTETYADSLDGYTINFDYSLLQTEEDYVDLDTYEGAFLDKSIEELEDTGYQFIFKDLTTSVDYNTKVVTISTDVIFTYCM